MYLIRSPSQTHNHACLYERQYMRNQKQKMTSMKTKPPPSCLAQNINGMELDVHGTVNLLSSRQFSFYINPSKSQKLFKNINLIIFHIKHIVLKIKLKIISNTSKNNPKAVSNTLAISIIVDCIKPFYFYFYPSIFTPF